MKRCEQYVRPSEFKGKSNVSASSMTAIKRKERYFIQTSAVGFSPLIGISSIRSNPEHITVNRLNEEHITRLLVKQLREIEERLSIARAVNKTTNLLVHETKT